MTGQSPLPTRTPTPDHEPCRSQIFELRHRVLVATDRAIGAEVELERARKELQQRPPASAQRTEELRTVRAERDRLARELKAVYASESWRVGSRLVGTLARAAAAGRRKRRT